jgi:hypothetical protein
MGIGAAHPGLLLQGGPLRDLSNGAEILPFCREAD